MQVNLSKTAIQNFLALLDAQNVNAPTDPSQITLSSLQADTNPADASDDTSVVISGVAGKGFSGSVKVYYRRLQLSAQITSRASPLSLQVGTTTAAAQAALIAYYGLLSSEVTLPSFSAQSTAGTQSVSVKALGSLVYNDATATASILWTANTVMLLHLDGANAATSGAGFTDTAKPARVITNSGSLPLSTTQSKFGGSSLLANTSSGCLQTADSSELEFKSDTTLEFFMYLNANSTTQVLAFKATSGPANGGRIQTYQGTLVIYSDQDASSPGKQTLQVPAAALKTGQWQHVAFVIDNVTWRCYIDGVQQASVTATGKTWGNNTGPLEIGGITWSSGYQANAYLDEFRISKIARYKNGTTFIPPTQAFVLD